MLAVAALSGTLLTGCDDGTVTLRFRPAEGQELDYVTTVDSVTTTHLPCFPPTAPRRDRTSLDAHQRILEVGDDGVLVEVALSRPGIGTRTFTMRFDRAAQLTEVERVEGIPAEALGELGLSEIFPAAAGAPPAEPLAPGDRWTIDDVVLLTGQDEPTRLVGVGHLVELGVEDGIDVATVESTTALPVNTRTEASTGTRSLNGVQQTSVTATYELADGALRRADAVTTGSFALVLGPPPGGGGDPCSGTLEVEVRSSVTRVD